jgi:hypothetical protein
MVTGRLTIAKLRIVDVILTYPQTLPQKATSMKDSGTIPPHMQAVEPSKNRGKRSSIWFCVSFVAFELLCLIVSFWAATQPWFMKYHHSPAMRMLGYGHRVVNANCDVLLYGDSTALADLVPSVIERKTGLKSCNISEVRSVGDFAGQSYALDDYLSRNRKPKYLVSAWSPGNFHLNHAPMLTFSPEAYAYALPYVHDSWLWMGFLREPGHAINFLAWVQNSLVAELRDKLTHSSSKLNTEVTLRDAQAGMWAMQGPPEQACKGGAFKSVSSTYEQNAEGVKEFRSKYEAKGIQVIVDVTPIANCIPELQTDIAVTRGLSDNSFQALPIQNFNDQDIHLTSDAAVRFSEEAANQVLKFTQQQEGRNP